MVAFGSIIPLEQGGRRVFGMSWMPVSGVCIGSRVERAVRDASRTHFHVGTGISWNLETPGVSRKKQRDTNQESTSPSAHLQNTELFILNIIMI